MEDNSFDTAQKYQLITPWILYFHEKNVEQVYINNIIKLIEIKTVADFWGTVNNIPMPIDLFSVNGKTKILRINECYYVPNAYSFFKDGMFPTWENTRNGSEVCIKSHSLENINRYFNELMILCVSNNDTILDDLIGIRVVDASYGIKNNYKVELWFNTICDFDYIKKYLYNNLNTESNIILYREHLHMKE